MKPVSSVWKALAVFVAIAGMAALALRLFTWFGVYDDEGYMLVTLAHYVTQGHLYTETFSQYGPFYFYAQSIFFQLSHLPVTHDMGRLATLCYWVVSSLLCSLFVHRLSKSTILASAGGLCLMLVGLVLSNEPGHSQQVLLLLYLVAACLSQLPESGAYSGRLFSLGCVGAALLFTKINVGVFFLAGFALALFCLMPWGKLRLMGVGVMLLYAAAVPWVLMHGGFDRGFRGYCVLATASTLATWACGVLLKPDEPLPWRAALVSGAGVLTGLAVIVAGVLLQGMSLNTLIAGVILNPMHHPKVFDIPLYLGGRHVLAGVALIAGVVFLRFWGQRLTSDARWLDLLRCVVGVLAIFLLTLPDGAALILSPVIGDPLRVLVDSSVHRIQWVAPLLAFTLIPQPHWERHGTALFSRLFVTFMAVTQFLEAYPVAGSQMGIAAAPMILWAFVLINDGVTGLRMTAVRPVRSPAISFPWDAVTGGLLLVVLAGLSVGLGAQSRFPQATKLKGSTWLHLPEKQTSQYETIVQDVRANCGILFSEPGLGSFNMWSDVPTPNGWNLTAWMKGFNADKQAEILGLMQQNPRACAIVNHGIVRFWDRDEAAVAALPLAHYLTIDMPKVADVGDYEIHVSPQRKEPWLGTPEPIAIR